VARIPVVLLRGFQLFQKRFQLLLRRGVILVLRLEAMDRLQLLVNVVLGSFQFFFRLLQAVVSFVVCHGKGASGEAVLDAGLR
jgi:hypothetical protein